MTLIELKDLTVQLNGEVILSNINFHIDFGEIITIIGPNGSGKTSLLRVLIGALSPMHGTVSRKADLRIGYGPQSLTIDQTLPLTVKRFMSLPRLRRPGIEEALNHAGVVGLADRQMSELSGGQFQRVLLARAVLEKPDLLILDEATQGLDQSGEAAFYQKIAELREKFACAVLLVSHDLHVVMSGSDRVICLNRQICCEGTPEVVASAEEWRAMFGASKKGTLALYRHEHIQNHTQRDEIGGV